MNNNFTPRSQKYLIESLNKHSIGNLHEEFLREFGIDPAIAVDAYSKTKLPKVEKKGMFDTLIDTLDPGAAARDKTRKENRDATIKRGTSGSGYGRGLGRGKKGEGVDKDGNPDNILFGDTDIGLGTAALAYGAGTGLDWMGSLLGNKATSLIGASSLKKIIPGLDKIPGALDALAGQAADISGSSWFDANISKIGSNAQQLATQGAGSPWVPLATSTRKGFSPTEPEDPLAARKRAVAQRQLEAQEKKYGITP